MQCYPEFIYFSFTHSFICSSDRAAIMYYTLSTHQECVCLLPDRGLKYNHIPFNIKTATFSRWPVWLIGCSIVPCTKSLWVRFLVRAEAQVAGLVPCCLGGKPSMFLSDINVSLSLSVSASVSLSLSQINKCILRWGFKKEKLKVSIFPPQNSSL